jgi:hypothetical protein
MNAAGGQHSNLWSDRCARASAIEMKSIQKIEPYTESPSSSIGIPPAIVIGQSFLANGTPGE